MIRFLIFAALWIVLTEADAEALAVGVVAAATASWASLRLLEPHAGRVRPLAIARFAIHFMKLSVYSGIDVAWRALHPRRPLDPDLVAVRTSLPPGMARTTLASELSLLPGTLAVSQDGTEIVLHCLDRTQPITAQMRYEEALIERILGTASDRPTVSPGPDAGAGAGLRQEAGGD